VLGCALRASDLRVRDVTDERVSERELGLALDGRAALAAQEPLALERVQAGGEAARVAAERARPEHLPDHGGVSEELLLVLAEHVQARGDDALERLREREILARAAFRVELRELFRVQRVPARALEERLLRGYVEQRPFQEPAEQPGGLGVGERLERDRRRVQLAAAPAGSSLEQLRPRRRDDE
jgi:hypothetical protein